MEMTSYGTIGIIDTTSIYMIYKYHSCNITVTFIIFSYIIYRRPLIRKATGDVSLNEGEQKRRATLRDLLQKAVQGQELSAEAASRSLARP